MKIKRIIIAFALMFLGWTKTAAANPACAVCTVAVSAALGVSRELGVDDTVVGVWCGGLLMQIAFWTITFCVRRNWKFHGMGIFFILISLSLIIPLYTMDYIVFQARTILGIDAFLLSVLVGAFIILASDVAYRMMKDYNGGHAHFPFEKVVIPVAALAVASVVFYFGADYITNNDTVAAVLPSAEDLM